MRPEQSATPGWYDSPRGEGQTYWDGERWTDQRRSSAPGWYPNPEAHGLRYFDGARWTDNYSATEPERNDGLEAAGWACAIFLPIIGIVIGAVLVDRGSSQGGWIMGTSALVMLIAVGAILALAGGL